MDQNKFEIENGAENDAMSEVDAIFNDKDFIEGQAIDSQDSDNAQSNDFTPDDTEVFDKDTDLNIEITTTPISVMPPAAKSKGLKVFIAILSFFLALSIAVGAGYLVGKNQNSSAIGGLQLNPKPQNDEILSAAEVYKTVSPSVVGIMVYNAEGVTGYASGVVYSEDGYIITNDHIYEEVTDAKFKVYDYAGKSYDAAYLAGDTRSDLAVLKIDADGFFPAVFGDSNQIEFGEDVVAVGRPSDPTDNSSITKGIVSYPNRRVSNSSNYSSRLIQTDSAINPGSSGGALVNMFGQVIGITSSKLVGSSYEGIGYAIPTTTVKKVVESLIEHGAVVNRGKLGFTYQEISTVADSKKYGSYGLLVVSISEESDMLGKVNSGDIITAVNGQKITKDDILIDVLENTTPGSTLTFDVLTKNGANKQIKVAVIQDLGTSSYKTTHEENDLPLLP